MSFIAKLQRAREILAQQGRLSVRALERELEIGGDELEEIIEELVDVQQVVRREGRVLVWQAPTNARATTSTQPADRVSPSRSTDGAEVRKVVTIVFADLIGSTALHERLDPESVSRVMERYHSAVRAPVEAHGGTVVQLLGDGVMCAFGVPHVAEDDAIRAVRAAVGIQHAFQEFARAERAVVGTTGLRVAVNTGEVVVSDDYAAGIGDPLNVAARLQQEATDGDVLIGESTRRLVSELVTLEPLGVFSLKGRAETVKAYRVVSLDRPAGASATAFVGRDSELRRLLAVYDSAVATPAARLAVILGSPGLGKSRLLDELARRLGDLPGSAGGPSAARTPATILSAQCEAAGGATFAPIAKALRTHLRIGDGTGGDELRAAIEAAVPGADVEDARIIDGIAALLAGTPASPEETFFVVRRLLARLAATQPVVLAIDDLHWAEPLLLDLIEHLVQWSTDVPLLLLVAARPELREVRSSLAAPGGLVGEVVTLAGLDAGAATRLAANVIGADELPAAVAGRVLATSEGNPLFVGELVRMLVHDGALKREGERWTTGVELAGLEMPPTIQALLAARIERLRPEERIVLERAAVVGRQFSRAAVTHLLPREVTDLDARLEALRRSELIEPDMGWFLGEPVLRFHHVLIRDAAYRRLLKNTRAELHGRFAEWVEARVGESVEHDETIGWHLEQAHQHLRELGPLDQHGRALGERAARYLAAAGRRALARDDLPVAANLLGRAIDRLEAADPTRAELALDWCEALLAAGDVGQARNAIDELGRFAEVAGGWGLGAGGVATHGTAGSATPSETSPQPPAPSPRGDGRLGRLRAWHACFAGQLAVLTDPQALRATADTVAAAADELAAAGDAAGEAKAYLVHALALARLGKVGVCEAALDRALAAARRAHDRRRANMVLANAPLAALWGPSPVTRASGRCLDVVRVLRITQGAPAVEAVALRCQAVLEALRGRSEAARRMIASARRMVEELGITQQLLEADVFTGLIDVLEGDAVAAERTLRGAYDGLRNHGLAIDAARAAAFLGRALLAQGRAAEAEALSQDSEALAGDDLQAAITWRAVRAESLATRGEHAAAVDFARAAVELAAVTDALLLHADARLALATALRAACQGDEAEAEEGRAIELWEAKGATLLAERARRHAGRVEHVARAPDDRAGSARPARRAVRANAATENAARVDAAVAARDAGALLTLVAEHLEVVHHPTGAVYGRQGVLDSFTSLFFRAEDMAYRHEPLATLGDSLALCRLSMSFAALAGDQFTIGAVSGDQIVLIEVDARGGRTRAELFAPSRLGDAVARLYERYAELLPAGDASVRTAATARAMAALGGPFNLDRYATAITPTLAFVDHRSVVGIGSAHGAAAFLEWISTLAEVSDDVVVRIDDTVGLRADALLLRMMTSGTVRTGGGAYERRFLSLLVFGPDGLAARIEHFDTDHYDHALARFDELVKEGEPSGEMRGSAEASPSQAAPAIRAERPVRRVRPNAMTAGAARLDAAMAARDAEALLALDAEDLEVIDHPTGATYGRAGNLASRRALLRAQDLKFRHEPLATLGDLLALLRLSIAASGVAGGNFDVGAYEREVLVLADGDIHGRSGCSELFAVDRLGEAVARLYERYAELLPAGLARVRAAATARSVAALLGPPDRWPFAPDAEATDHRTVGFGSLRGADAVLQAIRALLQLSDDWAARIDDVVDLRSDALLVRWTTSGTLRVSGGVFERNLLMLWVFGADGLLTRWEQFDPDRDAEALARFDALVLSPAKGLTTAPPRPARRRVRPNAATALAARLDAAVAARDTDALYTLLSEQAETVDHTMGVVYDRAGSLTTWRRYFRAQDLSYGQEPLASLGNSLALCRVSMSGSGGPGGRFDVGAFEGESVHLIEVGAAERRQRLEMFAPDRLGDAIVRLYERYAELVPEGPARERAAATARSVATLFAPFDLDRYATAIAPAIEFIDHRILGFGVLRGTKRVLHGLRGFLDVAADIAYHVDDVLDVQSDAFLMRSTSVGTVRSSGGAFDRLVLVLCVFGSNGLATRIEYFDPDRHDDAQARFAELAAEPPAFAAAPSRAAVKRERRVRANPATAHLARMEAAAEARDADAFTALLADDAEMIEHPTGATFGRQGILINLRSTLSARDLTYRFEPLATLGDSLALSRHSMSASGMARGKFDVGAYEREEIGLTQVDSRGRCRLYESFAVDRLGDAVARLYGRYAELLPDGPARARAAAIARSVAGWVGPLDLERAAVPLAPTVESVDHRTLGTWSAQGKEALLEQMRALVALAEGIVLRDDDVLDLRSDALLVRRTNCGTDRASGGAYERPYLMLWTLGADGLVTRNEIFDADREAEALARFDELVVSPVEGLAAAPFANAATRACDAFIRCWDARDWDGVVATLAPTVRAIDRRRLTGLDLESSEALASLRIIYEWPGSRWHRDLLATRGERLALLRCRVQSEDGAASLAELEYVEIVEVDAAGRGLIDVAFDLDDLDAAYAELDARYVAGEAAPYAATLEAFERVERGMAMRDFEELASVYAPDLVVEDHRLLGWGTLGRDEHLALLRALVELAPDVVLRIDHVLAIGVRGGLAVGRWVGTREGVPFETPLAAVTVLGPDWRIRQVHAYDLDQLDAARVLYDELTTERPIHPSESHLGRGRTEEGSPPARFENAATRVGDRLREAMEARDWKRFAAFFAAGFRSIDRQRMAQLEANRDRYLDAWRPIFETFSFSTITSDLLATRGDRLLLARVRWTGRGHSVGPSEFEWLNILEVDDNGDPVAEINFDPDDLDAAYAELDARYVAGEAAPFGAVTTGARAFVAAVAARDWDALAAVLAPDLVIYDHRPLGWETLRGPAMLVDTWKSLVELAADARARIDHVTVSASGSLAVLTLLGTHEGGEFEDVRVVVHEYDGNGKIRRHDIYTVEQLDEARARFHGIGASAPRDPLAALAKPNGATAARDRAEAAFETRDWVALRALCAVNAKFEDRRRAVLVSVDVDGWIAERQRWARSEAHQERRLVGTAGNRVALERVLVTSRPPGGRSELEYLSLTEIDESGRILATVAFDPDDWRAANQEAWARWFAADAAAAAVVGPIFESTAGWNDHDPARVRNIFADSVVVDDRRRAGMGLLEGADAYVEALVPLWKLAPDIQVEPRFVLALEHYGMVSAGRIFGTFPEGGPFENQLVWVFIFARGRVTRLEIFEIEDADAALARFAELRPDPLRIPPNAATQTIDRAQAYSEHGGWDAFRALCAPSFVFDDRRRVMLTTGDRDHFVASAQYVHSHGARGARTVLATAGDTLALERVHFTGSEGAPVFEIDVLRLTEVDAEGRIVARIVFDPDDRRAASVEMFEHLVRSDAGRWMQPSTVEFLRARNNHDVDRMRALLPRDYVCHDHRRTGAGRLGADEYIDWLAALYEQSPDALIETLYVVAAEKHGILSVGRTSGTLTAGGEFESFFVMVSLFQGYGNGRTELFELEDLDLARARFEELRGEQFSQGGR